VILSSGDTETCLTRVSNKLGGGTEVVRVIRPDENSQLWRLDTLLSPEALRRDDIWGVVIANGDHQKVPAEWLLHCRLSGIWVVDESTFWEHGQGFIDI